MRISDWSSDVCSSDLGARPVLVGKAVAPQCAPTGSPGIRRQCLASALAHPPPSAWTISTLSPAASTCSACRLRGMISPLISTATRRCARCWASSRAARVVWSGSGRDCPLRMMSMRVLWPLAAAAASAMRHRTLSASGVRGNMRHHPPPYVEGGPIPQENSMASLSRPLRHTLAAALALAAAPVFAQGDSPYSNTVFFGDSLPDSGYFRPVLIQRSEEHTSELQSLMRISYA